jgi:glutathione S-transferase
MNYFTMRTLYHFPLLPACRAVRIQLKEKELDFEPRLENFWEERQEFLALNPAGEMPVLIEENGSAISGAYAIREYLEESYAEKSLLGKTPAERSEVRRLIDWFEMRFAPEVFQTIVFEKIFKKMMRQSGPDSQAIREGKQRLLYHLDYLTNLLSARYCLAGERLTLADLLASAHLSVLDYLGDMPWDHSKEVKHWYAILKSRPSFRPLLQDRIPSVRPPEHYENPDF